MLVTMQVIHRFMKFASRAEVILRLPELYFSLVLMLMLVLLVALGESIRLLQQTISIRQNT